MDEPTKFDAIKALCPNAEFTLRGDTLEWIKGNGDTEPSDSAITTKLAELKTDYANKEYQRKRADEYPTVFDQLDLIYHSGIDAWKTKIKETKDKYPKPN